MKLFKPFQAFKTSKCNNEEVSAVFRVSKW